MAIEQSKLKMYYLVAGIIAAIILTAYFLQHTFSALATSLALAYLLNPLLKYLDKRGFSRFLSITFIYGILAFAALVTSFFLIPYVGHQMDALTTMLPHYTKTVQEALEVWKRNLEPYFNPEELDWVVRHMDDAINRVASGVSGTGYERLKGVLFALFDLLLAPILIFFVLYYKEDLKEMLLSLVPGEMQLELKALGWKVNRTLEKYIWAMLIDCALVGVLCSLVLASLDIEFPILNGMFAGLVTIVPFLGGIVSVIPPAFIGYAKTGDLLIIPKVCAGYLLIHVVVEGNIIKPLIMRGALQLNPLTVIFAVMALGELMGFWGIVLAIPFAAVLKICGHELHEILRQRESDEKNNL